ncbi:Fe-S cluster assembly protein SufD [Bacteroidia bacterium]|nr:Fe-S cluster assembly protein SufD [Bacteroidia bacterium]GHT60881.1 Fe-S cluster assembly protein SufD [Bacteroidia bacterium]
MKGSSFTLYLVPFTLKQNIMQQYIDFFNSYRKEIDAGCAPLLNSFREKAFETFQQIGFPAYKSEDYQHINIIDLLKEDFGFYLNRSGININPHRVFHCDVPHLNSHKHFVVNGHFCEDETQKDLPPTVFSGSLNTFAQQYPELFSKYYNQLASEKKDGLAAFNTAFVQDGYVLYVPENVIIEKAIQLTHISAGNNHSLINRRMLFILESGAQAKLLVCDHAYDEHPATANTQVVEIFTGENAGLDFCELEESSPNTIRLTSNFVRQAAGSQVRMNSITLSNGITRNNYTIDLAGEHAEIYLYGMAIADGRQIVDNYTLINHLVPNCRCNELFKYILDDEATGAFCGRIIVAKHAQKTEAYQSNRNLLGNRNAHMFSKPQLEIYADDVKCSHGMTTGQLDENALFYICSRGIPKEEAVLLLKFAFTGDVIQGIRMEGLRDRLKLLIEKRFRGELVTCRNCAVETKS